MNDVTHHIGVLIVNLGTPDAPTTKAVRKYLAEFLWDPYVVQIPRPIWWLILRGLILPWRSPQTAKLYAKIWAQGSPLLQIMTSLVEKLQRSSDIAKDPFQYALAMRYGEPSIASALTRLREKHVTRLVLFPLYPQYSTTTTASTIAQVKSQLNKLQWSVPLSVISDYRDDPGYISAIAHSLQSHWQTQSPGQKLLFSFHGIPLRRISQGDPYFDHCVNTTQAVANALALPEDRYDMVFQSRFGREAWLQPYCDDVLRRLPQVGCQTVDVICPGFAVDCLETLEEISMRHKATFYQAGGTQFNYIPSLNDSTDHVTALTTILQRHLSTHP